MPSRGATEKALKGKGEYEKWIHAPQKGWKLVNCWDKSYPGTKELLGVDHEEKYDSIQL